MRDVMMIMGSLFHSPGHSSKMVGVFVLMLLSILSSAVEGY